MILCISQFRIKGILTIIIFLYRLSIFANGIVNSLSHLFNTDDVSTLDKVCLPFYWGSGSVILVFLHVHTFGTKITKKGLNTFSFHH